MDECDRNIRCIFIGTVVFILRFLFVATLRLVDACTSLSSLTCRGQVARETRCYLNEQTV